MSDLYIEFNPNTTLEQVKTLLSDLKDNSKDVNDKDTEENYTPDIQNQLDILTLSINQLSEYINKFQSTQDSTWLQQIKDEAANYIDSYQKAYDMTTFYTKEWFSNLYLSIEAKIDLAKFLIGVIQPICDSNLETLNLIAERNPDIILYITYPRSSD